MRTVVAVLGIGSALAACAPVACPAIGYAAPSRVVLPAVPDVASVELRLCQSGTCSTARATPAGGVAAPDLGSTRAERFEAGHGDVTVRLLTADGREALGAGGSVPVYVSSFGSGPCTQHVAHVDVIVGADGTVSGR
ncbi:hypothetical protein [Amycolatopsis sp. ATCC 39116]|uniref:hypothetical protein n=1 Tax=Amycolatopsis sp. (strain ATCC 39116 / 75iv2) TaxID=385957 RepID=UPI00026271B8|nr:hypothetical protein [Amycolatopsis sp. ATCC 39116]